MNGAPADGYKPFFPTGRMGEEVHYTNYRFARLKRRLVDYARPGSILYRRTPQGMQAIGVMYTAPRDATAAELNAIAPLSIATWHRHVDFCGAPRSARSNQRFGPRAPFGPPCSIHTEEQCQQAGGLWIPVALGWMTHVYPNAKSSDKVWSGMDMPMPTNIDPAHDGGRIREPGHAH